MNSSPQNNESVYQSSVDIPTNPNTPPGDVNMKIGSGTYGTVFMVDGNTIEKTMDLFDEDSEMSFRNIREVMFLKSFNAPFIPVIKSVNIVNNKIVIRENYCGITLDTYAQNLSYIERVRLLPKIMCQMGRILVWLKRHNVAHMDIKPSNLCIDSEGILHLIDFGLVGPVCKNSPSYTGTPNLCDPLAVSHNKRISYEYDMFGMGMCVIFFLNKNYVDVKPWLKLGSLDHTIAQEKVDSKLDLEYHKKNIERVNGSRVADLLEDMLRLNVDNRIKPFDLYGSVVFKDLWEIYPLVTDNYSEKLFSPKDEYVNNLKVLFEWIGQVLNATGTLHLLNYVTKLVFQIIGKKDIPKRFLQLYGVACVYIADMLFDLDTFSVDLCHSLCCNQYSTALIKMTVIRIITQLEWEIFPKEAMADWNIEFKNISCSNKKSIIQQNTDDFKFITKPESIKTYLRNYVS